MYLFVMKKGGETITSEEAALRTSAIQRGVRIQIIDDTNVQTVYSEVRRA
ncbi:hypothetical protein ACI2OX_17755 [Bacillus sp. N9]